MKIIRESKYEEKRDLRNNVIYVKTIWEKSEKTGKIYTRSIAIRQKIS